MLCRVLPTVKVLPHAQVMVASTYLGWIPDFMLLPRRYCRPLVTSVPVRLRVSRAPRSTYSLSPMAADRKQRGEPAMPRGTAPRRTLSLAGAAHGLRRGQGGCYTGIG